MWCRDPLALRPLAHRFVRHGSLLGWVREKKESEVSSDTSNSLKQSPFFSFGVFQIK